MRPFLPWQLRLGKTLLPGSLPLLLCKTNRGCTEAEKSFAVGSLLWACLKPVCFPPVPHSAERCLGDRLRSAIFGLGVLADHRDCPAQEYFPKPVGLLLTLLAWEQHDRVHGICGALTHLLMASPTRKPEPR